jgi:hypothetical protein
MDHVFWEALQDPVEPKGPKKKKRSVPWLEGFNLALIKNIRFDQTTHHRDAQVCTITLHDMERAIEYKQADINHNEPEADLITKKLPSCYREFTDVFSKNKSDTLPPFCGTGIDCKIDLEDGPDGKKINLVKVINCELLRQMSLPELEAAHSYLLENLGKGFIVDSYALFASPILMAYQNGKYRFCVDYRKLNALTTKD